MILYYLLYFVLKILSAIALVFGSLIPDMPSALVSLLDTFATMFNGGMTFISYFFYWEVICALITLVLSYYGFSVVKDSIMKVLGNFIGN